MDAVPAPIETGTKPDTRFKPGNNANPAGRPKGARSKLGEDFLKALQQDFEQNGVAAISEVRETKPDAYLKVIASILPKEIDFGEKGLVCSVDMSRLSDEQVRALASIRIMS